MSFLNQSVAPPVITKEQRLSNLSKRIKNLSKNIFEQLLQTQRDGIKMVWNNPTLTPQEIIDELGDDAIKIFQFHGGLTEYINTIATIENLEIELSYPTNAFTIDAQGKITVTDQPYIP
jgi:hypothetical protein